MATTTVIVTHLRSDGKTNLDTLHDTENVMRLCVTCHHALDSAGLPGWVFLPADLDFFFHAEQEDFNRRQRQFRRTGLFPIRQYPPVKDYVEHCGTYDAYMLRAYGAPTSGWRPGPSAFMTTSKAWQGDPMVALFKGFHAFAYEHLLPPKLRDLNLLYRRNDAGPRSPSRTSTAGLNCRADPIPPASRSNRSNRQPGPGDADNSPASATALPGPGHRGRGRGRPPGGRGGGAPNHSPRGNGAALNQGPYTGTRSRKRQLDRWDGAPPPKRLEVGPSPWVWGPHKTANEVGECLSDQKARMRARIPEQRRKELEMENSVGRLPSPENTEVSYEPQTARDLDVEYSRVVQWLSGVTGTE
ncbi:MAG: hypothetical protein LQ344_005133 [Seirophora lacunosa]|nr:MAG: hypothetical protein LQ344_005133 [Seirophora lacunosa]